MLLSIPDLQPRLVLCSGPGLSYQSSMGITELLTKKLRFGYEREDTHVLTQILTQILNRKA